MNSIMMNRERVDVQFHDSSGGLRDTMDAMGERETQRIQQQSEGPTRDSSVKGNSRQA